MDLKIDDFYCLSNKTYGKCSAGELDLKIHGEIKKLTYQILKICNPQLRVDFSSFFLSNSICNAFVNFENKILYSSNKKAVDQMLNTT